MNLLLFLRTGTCWSVQGRDLLADDRILRSFIDINLRPMRIVLGHVGISKDCFHRTLRNAGIAIDASVGIDVEAISQFMKCFDRTDSGTVGVLAVDTQFNNHIGHRGSKLLSVMANSYSAASVMSTVNITGQDREDMSKKLV